MVGTGAVIFHDLKNHRMNDIEFSLEEMLNFEGETGPYVQYTHARICSLLRKGQYNIKTSQFEGYLMKLGLLSYRLKDSQKWWRKRLSLQILHKLPSF